MTPRNGKYLLDSNVVIALLQGDEAVAACLREAEAVSVPIVVIGELYYGAAKSARSAENRARIDRFTEGRKILGCDVPTAREYGRVKLQLRSKGRPIPENDIWIAATAIRHGLTLVTRDSHFDEVSDLTVVSWT